MRSFFQYSTFHRNNPCGGAVNPASARDLLSRARDRSLAVFSPDPTSMSEPVRILTILYRNPSAEYSRMISGPSRVTVISRIVRTLLCFLFRLEVKAEKSCVPIKREAALFIASRSSDPGMTVRYFRINTQGSSEFQR